jgi:predicted hydrocarbon binding protein
MRSILGSILLQSTFERSTARSQLDRIDVLSFITIIGIDRMSIPTETRANLGGFISIICFKSAIVGMEEALGEKAAAIALITAGRTRGKKLAIELGLSGANTDLETIATKLNMALGSEGTRLTKVNKIVRERNIIKVYCLETVCSVNEPQGSSRKCTFTMGAVWGALSEILGQKLRGVHTDSVLRGAERDVFEFTPVE